MSPAEKASALAETFSQILGVDASAVPESDRVTADLSVIRGGWKIVVGKQTVARVDDDGEIRAMTLESLNALRAA